MSEGFMYLQVCAPTGAGKTNIAMISILHEVCNQWTAYGSFLNIQLFLLYQILLNGSTRLQIMICHVLLCEALADWLVVMVYVRGYVVWWPGEITFNALYISPLFYVVCIWKILFSYCLLNFLTIIFFLAV